MVTFSARARKRMLIAANVALAGGIVSSVCVLSFTPLDGRRETAAHGASAKTIESQSSRKVKPLKFYAAVYERDLRKPLFDPERKEIPKPRPKAPRLNVHLLGTAVEPGHTLAFFKTGDGRTEMLPVGKTVDGAQILQITEGAVKLKFHDKVVTLTVDKDRK